ncbi:MAG: FecR domain-containing protein [Spirochaetales bacterium]|nr:FecR domain-containing protein [Spirochaetales bacterium]
MNRKKYLLDWAKKLNDSDLKTHYSMNNPLQQTPSGVYDKIIRDIRNSAHRQSEKRSIPERLKWFFVFHKPGLKYSLSFAGFFAVLVLTVFLFIRLQDFSPDLTQSICNVSALNGELVLTTSDKQQAVGAGAQITESALIESGENSNAVIKIGDKSTVVMRENSKVEFIELYNKEGIERTRLFLKQGSLHCWQQEDSRGSKFSISTETIELSVIGTEFIVSVDDQETKVFVMKGNVSIVPKIEVREVAQIRNIDADFADKISSIIESTIILSKQEKLILSHTELAEAQDKITEVLLPIATELENHKGSADEIREIINKTGPKIEEIDGLRKEIVKKQTVHSPSSRNTKPLNTETKAPMSFINKTQFVVLSPANKYYTHKPQFMYDFINIDEMEVYLNNRLVRIENTDILSGAKTGFNNFKIRAVDSTGEEHLYETEFFVNNLVLADIDTFNRADNYLVGNNWYEKEKNSGHETGRILNNRLVFTGPVQNSPASFSLVKKYFPELNKEIIQLIDIADLNASDSGYVSVQLGIYGYVPYSPDFDPNKIPTTWRAAIQLILETNNGEDFNFYFQERQYYTVDRTWNITEKEHLNLDFDSAKRLVFYKNNRSFYGIILDSDNNILKKVVRHNYISHIDGRLFLFNGRRIAGSITDTTASPGTFMEIDNYYYYK